LGHRHPCIRAELCRGHGRRKIYALCDGFIPMEEIQGRISASTGGARLADCFMGRFLRLGQRLEFLASEIWLRVSGYCGKIMLRSAASKGTIRRRAIQHRSQMCCKDGRREGPDVGKFRNPATNAGVAQKKDWRQPERWRRPCRRSGLAPAPSGSRHKP